MKKTILLLTSIISLSLFAQNTQLISTEAYSILKSNGQLDNHVNYIFPNNSGGQVNTHLSKKELPTWSEKSLCSCLTPLDTTFSVVPFNGGIAPDYTNDDGSTSAISLPFSFNFYGVNYDSLYINNNGNISFLTSYPQFTANSFPDSNFNMIAPFWGDVDTRDSASGLVYYKLTPTYMIIKWENVGYYNIHSDLTNTFQLTITNGLDTIVPNGNNVSFCYGDMQWTTGEASQGIGGFGGAAATVGVNQGNGTDYFQVGTFDAAGANFDGPYNLTDGVDFLDYQEIYFDLSTTGNVPPLIMSSYTCDTIDVYTGDTLKSMHIDSTVFTINVMTPEIDQIVGATISCDQPDHFAYFLSKDTPTFKEYTCTFYATNLMDNEAEQLFHVTVNAWDNWIPSGVSSQTIVIRTNYNNNLGAAGIMDNELNVPFSIYPNPTDGILNIRHNYQSSSNPILSIVDISGKTVVDGTSVQNDQIIDINVLGSGIYFAVIKTNTGTIDTIKISKK
jgi:hypothetical protein